MTHAYTPGVNSAIRKGNVKLVPGTKSFYNTEWDPEEKNNRFFEEDEQRQKYISYLEKYMADWMAHIDAREAATKRGVDQENCYPQFERFNWL
ncbi:Oidioi.mRNA.OKI2018_I69.chr1.g2343.t1.cds [Oikopleura dioica]|uniref:Oidioi.mRNA.OKI2018_I69.chr1.g2343.t1.cds n=1 Tax=Oikopleura dioica TaxID=34765 RepID=A0ABN7SQU8_OIKDI|nr:Oidioi.mRNA.OKI2018_I69.chr1.g2343.t1.cds [Oikopleura dioica]